MTKQSPWWHYFDGGNEEGTLIVQLVEGNMKAYGGNQGTTRKKKKSAISKAQSYLLKT